MTTVLDDVEPLSEEEWRIINEEDMRTWFDEKTKIIFAICDGWPDLAEKFCKEVADHFGPHPKLGPLIKSRISVDRIGKPKGKIKNEFKWSHDYFEVFLLKYTHHCLNEGRATALKKTGELFVLTEAGVRKKVTEARRTLKPSQLQEWARDYNFKK